MHVVTLTAPVFGTNCYLVSAAESGPCVIVDPGGGVTPVVQAEVAQRRLEPVALLATHGHVDHTWSAAELCDAYGIKLAIHAADAYRLTDPFGTLERRYTGADDGPSHLASGPLGQALAAAGCPPSSYRTPTRIDQFDGRRTRFEVAGLVVSAVHAPGHTQGSTLYLVDQPVSDQSVLPPRGAQLAAGTTRAAFTGDVLFAGTIGRTDLPGGDDQTMQSTLRDVVAKLAPETLVLPGHGPASTMAEELTSNPFLLRR